MTQMTSILESIDQGGRQAANELLPLVYAELRKLAAAKMSHESPNQTLQPTALVHEAWLRLAGNQSPRFDGRGHFFAAASEAMPRIVSPCGFPLPCCRAPWVSHRRAAVRAAVDRASRSTRPKRSGMRAPCFRPKKPLHKHFIHLII